MSGKLIIDGYNLPAGGKCKIFANGTEMDSMMRGDKLTLNIDSDTEFHGKVSINPKGPSILVKDGKVTQVHLEWDKVWGKVSFVVDSEIEIAEYVCDPKDSIESPIYDLKGARGRYIKIFEDKCVLGTNAGFASFLTGNATDGEKTIYYCDLIGVQFKRSGFTLGYIQLETASALMNNKSSNFFNENSFTFDDKLELEAKEIAEFIQKKVSESKQQKTNPVAQTVVATSNADELKKYKDLLDSGVITQEEFDAKKKQLLNL